MAALTTLISHVGQEGHEPRSLDGFAHGVLADGGAAALATAEELALPARQLGKQFDVLVVDVHRARSGAIDENRVFSLRAGADFGSLFGRRLHEEAIKDNRVVQMRTVSLSKERPNVKAARSEISRGVGYRG